MKPAEKITKEQFDSLASETITKKDYDAIISAINLRVYEIMRLCRSSSGWTDYDTEDEDNDRGGYFDVSRYKDYITLNGSYFHDWFAAMDYSFPTRWLWEDYEQELEKIKADYAEKARIEQERKEREKKANEESRKALIESIKAKLTPEELTIVMFKQK